MQLAAAYQQAGCIEGAKAAMQEGLALGPGVHALGSVRGYTADLELRSRRENVHFFRSSAGNLAARRSRCSRFGKSFPGA